MIQQFNFTSWLNKVLLLVFLSLIPFSNAFAWEPTRVQINSFFEVLLKRAEIRNFYVRFNRILGNDLYDDVDFRTLIIADFKKNFPDASIETVVTRSGLMVPHHWVDPENFLHDVTTHTYNETMLTKMEIILKPISIGSLPSERYLYQVVAMEVLTALQEDQYDLLKHGILAWSFKNKSNPIDSPLVTQVKKYIQANGHPEEFFLPLNEKYEAKLLDHLIHHPENLYTDFSKLYWDSLGSRFSYFLEKLLSLPHLPVEKWVEWSHDKTNGDFFSDLVEQFTKFLTQKTNRVTLTSFDNPILTLLKRLAQFPFNHSNLQFQVQHALLKGTGEVLDRFFSQLRSPQTIREFRNSANFHGLDLVLMVECGLNGDDWKNTSYYVQQFLDQLSEYFYLDKAEYSLKFYGADDADKKRFSEQTNRIHTALLYLESEGILQRDRYAKSDLLFAHILMLMADHPPVENTSLAGWFTWAQETMGAKSRWPKGNQRWFQSNPTILKTRALVSFSECTSLIHGLKIGISESFQPSK